MNFNLVERFGGQPDLVRELIRLYLDTTPGYIKNIDPGISGGDREQVAQAAHSLKGSSAEIGAEQLAQFCHQLHMAVMNGESDSLAQLAKAVADCYSETAAVLEALDIH